MNPIRPRAYLETSVVSYLVARPSRDVVVLGHQETTRAWWDSSLALHDAYVSELVYSEAGRGDPRAASQRLKAIEQYPVLAISEEARHLADLYIREIPLPAKASADALHLAIATLNRMDYVVTWNCEHIAQGRVKRRLEEINRAHGLAVPTICTPEELFYEDSGLD
jgi:predicted nucleic acid-binding protein